MLLPAHAVLAAAGGGERVRRWLRHLAWLGLALLPLLYLLVHARLERDTLYYLAAPGPRDLVRITREYLAGYTTTRAIYAAGLGVAAIAVLWAAARARRDMPESIGDALRRPFAVVVTLGAAGAGAGLRRVAGRAPVRVPLPDRGAAQGPCCCSGPASSRCPARRPP